MRTLLSIWRVLRIPKVALLVDLDGVVVHSQAAQDQAWRWWCGLYGLDPARFLSAHGLTGAEKIRRYGPPGMDAKAEATRITEYEVTHTEGVEAADGVGFIWTLEKPWMVVTSARLALAQARLHAAGLRLPREMVTAESVQHGKPDPEPYLMAAKRLGVKPKNCTVIEDAPAGVQAGLAAGMTVIAVTTTVSAEELSDAHYVEPDLMHAYFLWNRLDYLRWWADV